MSLFNVIGNLFSKDKPSKKELVYTIFQLKNEIEADQNKLKVLHEEYDEFNSQYLYHSVELNKAIDTALKNEIPELQKTKGKVDDKYNYRLKSHFTDIENIILDLSKKQDSLIKAKAKDESIDFKFKDYMHHNIGRSRKSMPQIDKKYIDSFLIHFAGKASVKKVKRKLSDLKPSQKELDTDKVINIISSKKPYEEGYIISKDNYLVDGHHNWAGQLEDDGPDKEVECYRISVPIKRLLRRSNQLKITKQRDLDDKLIKGLHPFFEQLNFDSSMILSKAFEPGYSPGVLKELYTHDLLQQLQQNVIERFYQETDQRPKFQDMDVVHQALVEITKGFADNEEILSKAKENYERLIKANRADGTYYVDQGEEGLKEFINQESFEPDMQVGEKVIATWTGANTGDKYISDDLQIQSIGDTSITLTFTKDFITNNKLGYVYKEGDVIFIPRTSSPGWSINNYMERYVIPAFELTKEVIDGLRNNNVVVKPDDNKVDSWDSILKRYNDNYRGFDLNTICNDIKTDLSVLATDPNNINITIDLNNTDTNIFSIKVTCIKPEVNIEYSFHVIDDQKIAYLNNIFINKIFRKTGVGKRMLQYFIKQYDKCNVNQLQVDVKVDNSLDWGYLWLKSGFKCLVEDAGKMIKKARKLINKKVLIDYDSNINGDSITEKEQYYTVTKKDVEQLRQLYEAERLRAEKDKDDFNPIVFTTINDGLVAKAMISKLSWHGWLDYNDKELFDKVIFE